MDLTCLSIFPPLPLVPKTANDSNTTVHPAYEPNSGGLSQIISGLIIRSAFSTDDIHALLNNLFTKDISSWDISEIVKTKPIPSIIIYSSIALALVLIFSLIFCIVSCRNSKKYSEKNKRRSKLTQVCVCLLIIIYLIGIGDMIYVAYRINKSKVSMDDTIKEVNRDIYPREISEHMIYLNKQFNQLDQYCIESNSILINASKSLLVKGFDGILKEKYFVQDMVQTVNSIDKHIRELNEIVNQSTIPDQAITLFKEFEQEYQSMVHNLEIPITEVCIYANGTQTDIDIELLEVLNIVNVELKKLMNTINQDILSKITPWQEKMLMNIDFEEQIRGYVSMAGTIFLVLVIVVGTIPVIFFVFIVISRLCDCCQNGLCDEDSDRIPMTSLGSISGTMPAEAYPDNDRHHRKKFTSRKFRQQNKPGNNVVLCLMRIAFVVMIILLVIMALLTGVYYVLDLAMQSTCRTVHDDQPFLVNLMSEKLIEMNVKFGNSSEMNTTIMNVIYDCRDQVHFSRKLLESYWLTLDNGVDDMMNMLSEQIYDQFIQSMGKIDIPSDIELLTTFATLANEPNITAIVKQIENDLINIDVYFREINSTNSTLPQSLVQTTIDEFEGYVKKVLESTVDGCPLPLATIYKTDTLVCHALGSSISGLWLSVFLFMTLITVGLCIFGVCVYKRLNSSSGLTRSRKNRF